MADTAPSLKLTYEGAAKLLAAAVAKARDMSVPQCICIVDTGGHLLTMARLDGADFQYADCSPMCIASHVSMAKSTQWPANFSGSNLQNAQMRGANLTAAKFENAMLAGADLREANLEGAVFLDANLTGADLRGARLDKADMRGAIGAR